MALDINNDTIDDLVVSAPSSDMARELQLSLGEFYFKTYNGKVFVYLGKAGKGIAKGAQPDYVIR